MSTVRAVISWMCCLCILDVLVEYEYSESCYFMCVLFVYFRCVGVV